MSWPHLLVAVLMAAIAGVGAWASPAVLRRLPEPPADDEPAADPEEAADAPDETDAVAPVQAPPDAPPVPEKIPYAALADRAGLGVRLGVVAAVAAAGIGLALGPHPTLPVWVVLSVLGALLAYVDWTTRLLPYLLVAPAYPVTVVLLVLASAVSGRWDALLRAGIAWLAVFALFFLMWFLYRRGLGYGDVRLSGVLGMSLGWLGWQQVVIGLYAAFLVGAVVGVALVFAKVVDRRGYAFGPFMLIGAWLGVVGPPLLVTTFG